MPPNTPTRAHAKRAPRISVASNTRQAKGIASQGAAKLRSAAVVAAVAGDAALVKAPRAAIQGGVSKTSARKTRAPPAAVQHACPSKFPEQSSSTQCANPGGKECGPVTRSKTPRTASLAAYEPAPSTPPAPKPAAQVCRRRACTAAQATPACDQVVSPALNMEPDAFSNLENPVVPSCEDSFATAIDLLAYEDRFCVFRICAIMRDVCRDTTRRQLQMRPASPSKAGSRHLLIAQSAAASEAAAVAKRRKTCASQPQNSNDEALPLRMSRHTLLTSVASRIQRSVHLGFVVKLVVSFTHGASCGMMRQHALANAVVARLFGQRLRDLVIHDVRAEMGRMLQVQPADAFIACLQSQACGRFSAATRDEWRRLDDVYRFDLVMHNIFFEHASSGHDLLCELAIISDPSRLEARSTRDSSTYNGLGPTALHLALMAGHTCTARLLLTYRADVNATDSEAEWSPQDFRQGVRTLTFNPLLWDSPSPAPLHNDMTPLIRAAQNGQESVVRLLIEFQADVHAKNCSGSTALMLAACGGHESIISLLIKLQADVNASTIGSERDGQTALMMAAAEGHEATVALLLEHRADVNAVSVCGESALMQSAMQGDASIAQLLIQHHADVNAANKDAQTAFALAALGGHDSVMRLLLRHNARISPDSLNSRLDSDGDTLLMWATCRGQECVVRVLLEQRADVNAADAACRTAMMEALEDGHESIVRLLAEYNADVNAVDANGATALMMATNSGNHSLVCHLLEVSADVNAADKKGCSALYDAARFGFDSIVCSLLERKADVNATTEGGETAIMPAAFCGHLSVLQLLIHGKANVNASTTKPGAAGVTALMMAARSCRHSAVRLLLEHQADVNAVNDRGNHALIMACLMRQNNVREHPEQSCNPPEVARRKHEACLCLLQSKADVSIKNNDGHTALDACLSRIWNMRGNFGRDRFENMIYGMIKAIQLRGCINLSHPRYAFGYTPQTDSEDEDCYNPRH